MDTLEEIGVIFVEIQLLAWVATFIVVFIDKLRGRCMPNFLCGGRYHLPKARPMAWWQQVLHAPVYLVVLLLIALLWLVFVPAMFIIESPAKLKTRRIKS